MFDSERYELSIGQRNILALEQADFGTPINNICITIRVKGRVNTVLLKRAIDAELKANSTLRTRINRDETQYICACEKETVPVYDFTSTDREGFSHWESAVAKEAFCIFDSPLYKFYIYRLGENEGGIVAKCHHLISDGWSQVMLANRLAKAYLDLLANRQPDETPLPEYNLHVEGERAYLNSRSYARDRAYWDELTDVSDAATSLKNVGGASFSRVGKRVDFRLPDTVNNAIHAFCAENRVAPFSVFYMALAVYMKRVTGAPRLCLGVPVFNRSNITEKQTMGMFVSTLPFIGELDDDLSLVEFNERLTDEWYDLLRYQRFPFSDIAALFREKHPGATGLFSIVLSYQNSKIMENDDASVFFSGRWHYSGYQSEQLCIHLCELEGDGRFTVTYDYLTQLFTTEEIASLHGYLVNILDEALSFPNRPLKALAVIGKEERERVLYGFNRTDKSIPKQDMYAMVARAAAAYPSRAAVICGGARHSYCALVKRAEVFASLGQGSRGPVAVLMEKGFDLFAAMVGIMRLGVPWLLIPDDVPENRLFEILADSGADCLFTAEKLLHSLPPIPSCIRVLCCEDGEYPDVAFAEPCRSLDALAYIVYTSGSTGKPKSVEIGARGVVNLACAMRGMYGHGAVLSLCSVGFDAFVIESAAALLNARTIVVPQGSETEDPAALAGLIRGYGVGFLSLTPSRLSAYMKEPRFASATAGLDTVICGGEHFPPELLYELKQMTSARIYNQYGPSETTVAVSTKLLNDASAITVGKPMDNCRMYVLDENLLPLPTGVFGDLYIGGVCVGRGYTDGDCGGFMQNPFEHGTRMYKTGDTARFTEDGEIDVAGRKDEQVKLRGARIEPAEAASKLALYPGVTGAAARVTHVGLTCWYTSEKQLGTAELASFLASYLPPYMIPSRFVRVDELKRTRNGKVDFSALTLPETHGGGGFCSADARRVAGLFETVLGLDAVPADGDYFALGGDSLKAMELLSLIEREYSSRLRVADLYALRTPAMIAELVSATGAGGARPTLKKAQKRERYPLTATQKSLFIESGMDPSGLAYNMPGALKLPEGTDIKRLEAAIAQVIDDEPMLRAYFEFSESGVCMRIADEVEFSLEHCGAGEFVRPFDLFTPPLFRAGTDGTSLFVDMHHIIADGVSMPVLTNRLNAAYFGKPFSSSVSFLDFACAEDGADAEQLSYWSERAKRAGALDLPTDMPHPKSFDYRGGKHVFAFSDGFSSELDEFCKKADATPFGVLACAFALLLRCVAGDDRITLGTPVSGRRKYSLLDVFGPFVNTLPLVIEFDGDETLADALKNTGKATTELLDNQDVSLFDITEAAGKNGEKPFGVIFNMTPPAELTFLGSPAETRELLTDTAKAELVLQAASGKDGYVFSLEYASSLFHHNTIEFYARCFERAAENIVRSGDTKLCDLDLLCDADRFELIDAPNNTYHPFLDLPMDARADMTAKRAPNRAAVVYHGKATTYRELLKRANALAGLLQERGVGVGDFVGIAARRTPDFVAAMLAILKAGAAYVPMLASFPENRLSYMVRISGAKLVLTDEDTAKSLPQLPCPALVMSFDHAPFVPVSKRSQRDVMHVLFTSGSTGEPKGVMLTHRSISNLLPSLAEYMNEGVSPILCCTNCVFDTFITETLYPLALGMTVVMADEDEMLPPWKLAKLITDNGVKTVQMTPSRMNMSLEDASFFSAMAGVKTAFVCGEVFSAALTAKLRSATKARLLNMYGPTETSVYITIGDLTDRDDGTVGCPLRNCRIYCLDERQRPVLPTARGELYAAGECVSAGYINRADLTEAAFLPDPFYPGETMYKTGDIGRLKLDGSYDYTGRRDHQIKLNGQRVELGEINTLLQKCTGVSECAVVADKKEDGSASLAAFVVMRQGCEFSAPALKKQLSESLPKYMLPSSFAALDALPRTASGKTDIRKLAASLRGECEPSKPAGTDVDASAAHDIFEENPPRADAPARQELETKAERPTQDAQDVPAAPVFTARGIRETVTKAWSAALGAAAPDNDDSFFDAGGTSLSALRVISKYFCEGLSMTMEQFYTAPTINGQCALLCTAFGVTDDSDGEVSEVNEVRENNADRENISVNTDGGAQKKADSATPASVCANTNEKSHSATGDAIRDSKPVLLTGATGFLGAHLLCSLLDAGAVSVLCPIRGGDAARLLSSLEYYFGKAWVKEHSERIEAAPGDISSPAIIESPYQRRRALSDVGLVVHAAGDVRHYGTSVETNSEGARNVAAFAMEAKAPLLHISTVSVCGDFLTSDPAQKYDFTEDDFDLGQNWKANAYVKGKFLAEKAVRELIPLGLDARIFRIGRLVGRSTDGKFQRNRDSSAFFAFCSGLGLLEMLPESFAALPIELSPVDETARAVVALRSSDRRVFHLFNDKAVPLRDLAAAFGSGFDLVSDSRFEAHLAELVKKGFGDRLATIIEVWTRYKLTPFNANPRCDATSRELYSAHLCFSAPDVGVLLRDFFEKGGV